VAIEKRIMVTKTLVIEKGLLVTKILAIENVGN